MEDTNVPMEPDNTSPPEILPVDDPRNEAPAQDLVASLSPEQDRLNSPESFQMEEMSRSDALMVEKALRMGWNLPEKYKQPLLNRLLFIALNDDPAKGKVSSHRERMSAIRTIMVAQGQSIDLMGVILNRKQDQVNVQVNVEQPKILKNASIEQLEGLQKIVKEIEAEKPALDKQKRKSTPTKRLPPDKTNEV